MSRISMLSVCLVASLVSASVNAAVVSIGSHINDGSLLNGTSSFEVVSANGRTLAGSGGSGNFNGVYYFQLPTIPGGSYLATANIGLTITNDLTGTTPVPVDLYGLGYINSAPTTTINNTWYYTGTNDTRTGTTLGTNIGSTPITKIANDFVVGGTSPVVIAAGTLWQTNSTQDATLTNYLNSLYTAGATSSSYAVFRVNADSTLPISPATRFEFGSRDNATAAFRPFLEMDIQEVPPVPEPSSLVLLALGFVALQRRARNRRMIVAA